MGRLLKNIAAALRPTKTKVFKKLKMN